MKRLLSTLALAGLLALCAPLVAQDRGADREQRKKDRSAKQEARQVTSRALAVSGEQLQANIDKLNNQLAWHDDVASALKTAQKEGKPVFLLHVLGERCGHT